MDENRQPAHLIPPGEILEVELEARGWSQRDLAEIMGRPPQAISEIIRGVKQITPETALELAAALGTSAEFWMNLETNYRLRLAQRNQDDNDRKISRRSKLFSLLPLKEILRRGWLPMEENLDRLEEQVCRFLKIASINETPVLAADFRCSDARDPEHTAKVAWVRRIEYLGDQQNAAPFNHEQFQQAIPAIRDLAVQVEDVARVPGLLREVGVRFVIVRHLPHTYADGVVCYTDRGPVVGLSLRYDRIDSFWFTLMHELAHISLGHKHTPIDNVDDKETNATGIEAEANEQARTWLIDQNVLQSFVAATKPFFSKAKIERFADLQQVHPGILVGQLQHDGILDYKIFRSLLVKVSPFLVDYTDANPS